MSLKCEICLVKFEWNKMQRPLNTFPIPSTIRSKLALNGYNIAEDLKDINATDLSSDINISLEHATELLTLINQTTITSPTCSLFDLQKEERNNRLIISFSQKLDEMLGGGIPLSKVTEICGQPGIGKTQLCMQLSIDVQIPNEFGGLGKEVIFIDTEGTFTVDRISQIAIATIQHCQNVASKRNNNNLIFNLSSILDGIHYFKCADHIELIATINLLEEFIHVHPLVRLIIIDSIAFPFRVHFENNLRTRTRILSELGQTLIRLAIDHQLAIVITNQMTTTFDSDGNSSLIPALGETWGHACTLRLILTWEGNQRLATLNKSPFKQGSSALFQITTAGIRDLIIDDLTVVKNINNKRYLEQRNCAIKKIKIDS